MEDVELVLSVSHKLGYETYPDSDSQSYQQFPHRVQKVMSGERTPILCGANPSFEMFMTKWEDTLRNTSV